MIEGKNSNNKSNNNNSNTNEANDISEDNIQNLLNKLRDIHHKSEVRTFDLNEKFNQIKDDLQNIIDAYKKNLYEEDEYETESNVDILSLNKYINNYMDKEREVSINNINSVFEQVTDTINQKLGNNSTERENIKTKIIETKNKFDGMCEETLNHFEEVKNQKNVIEDKINSQMEEQFGKVNDILSNEVEIEEKNRNDIINASQIYLADLGKKMKNEKIER
jgi:hypothetical protein